MILTGKGCKETFWGVRDVLDLDLTWEVGYVVVHTCKNSLSHILEICELCR